MSTYRFVTHCHTPIDQVWQWFERPGAMSRLAAPFGRLQPVGEADSLRDGTALLRPQVAGRMLPGPEWVAAHQPEDFIEGEQFVDVVTSQPYAVSTGWSHVHRFEPATDAACRVVDDLTTRLPRRMVAPIFAYRHDQLVDDLGAHARAATWSQQPVTVAITGVSGLIGTQLAAFLSTGGHRVISLVRKPSEHPLYEERHWDPTQPDPQILAGVDAVVHLAGASIAGRFTAAHMAAVRDSRVGPTQALARAAVAAGDPSVFVSASAIGYYGADRGDAILTETSDPGDDFLASVVREWEQATAPAADGGLRVVQVRTGIVQSARGGSLALLRPIVEAGLGGRLGDGQQWTAWIALDDLLDIYLRGVLDDSLSGPVNAVAPEAQRNADYTGTLGRVLRRPTAIPVPSFAPKLLFGDRGAREMVLAGQRVVPQVLIEAGHRFRWGELEAALRHELGR